MEDKLPKRFFAEGLEPQVEKVNNSCKLTILNRIKEALPEEYDTVKQDPVFASVFALHDNGLGFSGRLVNSMICRQLITNKKNDLWFVFGGTPLRFSLEEFISVTGLKYKEEECLDYEKWTYEKGFWGSLLRTGGKVNIKQLLGEHLKVVHSWSLDNRIRFVYICVIAGVVMARDEKKNIDHFFIKLVMDLNKLRNYPWGLKSFELLLESIVKARKEIKTKVVLNISKSYSLDGFSLALQVWAMEAIPALGILLGKQINSACFASRCSNWTGLAKISYEDIILLESTIKPEDVHSYISPTGNSDVIKAIEFQYKEDSTDLEVNNMEKLIESGSCFRDRIRESVEDDLVEGDGEVPDENDTGGDSDQIESHGEVPSHVSSPIKRKKKHPDHGVDTRKKKLLCQRAAASQEVSEMELKSIFTSVLDAISSLEKKVDITFEKVDSRFEMLEKNISELKELVGSPETAKTSVKSTQQSNKRDETIYYDCTGDLFSRSDVIDLNVSTQDFLEKSVGHLPQSSQVPEIDPTQNVIYEKVNFGGIPNLVDNDPVSKKQDAVLVYVPEEKWERFREWTMRHEKIILGPTIICDKVLGRLMTRPKPTGTQSWLRNEEIDAALYVFREKANLHRFKHERVGFMNCIISCHIQGEFKKYQQFTSKHSWSEQIQAYAKGELPVHGKSLKRWASGYSRIYAPIFVNKNHWISICINFVLRSIEVFDCHGNNNKRYVEPFATIIPRILKEISTKEEGKQNLKLTPYSITHAVVKKGINKSRSDCGVYALKYIECHVLGLSTYLMDDENIALARAKLAFDLWEAASDPIFVERVKKYPPPHSSLDDHDIDDV